MSLVKLNQLHLHFSDSESFSLELLSHPEVTRSGVYSLELTHTIESMIELNEFAALNGVIVVPETDSPGHTRSWANSEKFREVDSCHDYEPGEWMKYCLEPPCG